MEKLFTRGNGQRVNYNQMIKIIADYIKKDLKAEYDITIGTDSQTHSEVKIVEVIAVHKVGDGGIFFYHSEYRERFRALKEKIVEETSRSLENANGFLDNIELLLLEDNIDIEELNLNFHIHCDIGHKGKTKELIKEITNWVESLGYDCLIKPESYTASGIANKFSK
jgi:predicted RNase H-related nuclease YkuK (DUF458 family)